MCTDTDIKREFYDIIDQNVKKEVYDNELVTFSKSLIQHKENLPRLFRYSSADYWNIRNLEKQQLKLSESGVMNDIFEGFSCVTDDKTLKQINDFHDAAYIKAFSEEKDNLLMWAHYGDNYSGMCVEYDFSNLDEEILYHLFPVYYSKEKILEGSLNYLLKELYALKLADLNRSSIDETDFLKDYMAYFLIKPIEWEYEKEWRILVTYPQLTCSAEEIGAEDDAELFSVKNTIFAVKDCIKSVYLGARMEDSKKDHIKEICKEKLNNIPVYDTKMSAEHFKIEVK